MTTVTFLGLYPTFNAATKRLTALDTTNWAGQGISITNLQGFFEIYAPSGNVVYQNTDYSHSISAVPAGCDIYLNNSLASRQTIVIPINAGVMEEGLYRIVYNIWDNIGGSVIYTQEFTYNVIYSSPTVQISGAVDINTPLLTMYDNTIYLVNGVIPTLDRGMVITYLPALVDGVPFNIDPTTGSISPMTSNYFVAPSEVAMSLTSALTYVYSNFTVVDFVAGLINYDIPASSLCKYFCGLKNFSKLCRANPNDANLRATYSYLSALLFTAQGLLSCGKGTEATILLGMMDETTGFGSCCSECNDTIQIVVGIGGLVNAYDNQSANGYIIITSAIVGNTKVYTYQLSPTFVTLVTNLGISVTAINAAVATLQNQYNALYPSSDTVTSSDGSTVVDLSALCSGAMLVNHGTGWAVNDTFTVVGGTGTATMITVDSVSAGVITSWHISTSGLYSVLPSNPVVGTASGVGISATFNLFWKKDFDLKKPYLTSSLHSTIAVNSGAVFPLFGAGITIVKTGIYLVQYEGDCAIADGGNEVTLKYYFYKGVATTTPIGTDGTNDYRQTASFVPPSGLPNQKMAHNTIIYLTAGDVLNVGTSNSSAGISGSIYQRSLILQKIG